MARNRECEHTDAYIICPMCDEAAAIRRKPRAEQLGLPFVARFETFCEACDRPIHAGDLVIRRDGVYIHEDDE